jgi:hypothetical protein
LSRSRSTSDSRARRPVGREVGERAEVRVEVDGQRPQPQVAGEHVAGQEGARGLAAAALRRQRRHDVGPRHAGQPAQATLEQRLLALAGAHAQGAQLVAEAGEQRVRHRLSIDDRHVVELVPPGLALRLGDRRGRRLASKAIGRRVEVGEAHGRRHILSVWPGKIRSGFPVPMRCRLSSLPQPGDLLCGCGDRRVRAEVTPGDPPERVARAHPVGGGLLGLLALGATCGRRVRAGVGGVGGRRLLAASRVPGGIGAVASVPPDSRSATLGVRRLAII